MNRLLLAVCTALALTLCLSAASEAHKVNIFAYVDGESIVTDSGYSKSKRVQGGVVEVQDAASGEVLASGTTDDDGRCVFSVPAKAREGKLDLRLLLKAGEGHQTDWVVKYEEFAAGEPTATATVEESAEGQPPAEVSGQLPLQDGAGVVAVTGSALTPAEVEGIVRRELEPVKRMLAELNETGPTLTEIIGGIGWILGLFGIAAYMKSRSGSSR